MPIQLLKLADELILNIAQVAPISDLLQLRLTCQKLYNICDFPLNDRRHRLYLHPRSLYYAIDICNVPKWTKDITEVVILGSSETSMITREPSQWPDCRLDYHPWSQFPPTAEGEQILHYKDLISTKINSFTQNYASLIDGLRKLPRLRIIRYAGTAIDPGFCRVSAATIIAHAKQKDLWRNSFGNDGQPQMRAALRTIWWSDADVFINLLSCLARQITEVDIQQPMPAVKSRDYRSDFGPVLKRVDSFPGVKSVTYTAPGPRGWNSFVTKLLENMPALQTLQIDVSSVKYEKLLMSENLQVGENPPWEEDVDLRWKPSPIICPRNSPGLQTITIRGPYKTPYNIVARRLGEAFEPYTKDLYTLSIHSVVAPTEYCGSLHKLVVATLSCHASTVGDGEEVQEHL